MNTAYAEPATGDKEIAFITSLAAELWSEIDLNEVRATKRDLCIAATRRIDLLKADNKFLNERIRQLEAEKELFIEVIGNKNDRIDELESRIHYLE